MMVNLVSMQGQGWLENRYTGQIVAVLILLLLSFLVLILTRMILLPLIRRLIKKTRFEWDDVFLDANTFRWLSYIPPALVLMLASEILESGWLPEDVPKLTEGLALGLQNVAGSAIAFCLMLAAGAILTALNVIYGKREVAMSRPIKGYVQIAKIFVYVMGVAAATSLLFGESPWKLLGGIGAMTAVLMLVFKDTILSLVASVQLTSNDMVRVGDWIEVPSAGADGDVIDVALHTVKVQNWDKTIITVPTHDLIARSFKNWRGMQDSGGRRIKRSLVIDMSTIRFLEEKELDRLGKFVLLSDYVAQKRKELEEDNAKRCPDPSFVANARRLTNIGTFRAYLVAYLKSLPDIHEKMTFLVRHRQPTESGLPIEIYIFTNVTAWATYEGIQADIFDHLLAIMEEFDLRVFQRPTGHDIAGLGAVPTPAAAATTIASPTQD